MAKHAYVLTDDDMDVLRRLVRRERDRRVGSSGRHTPEAEIGTAPETYIARTPLGGIPALTEPTDTDLGTGSDADIGTGTGTARVEVLPGYADCDIYQILVDPYDNIPEIQPCGFTITVFNLTSVALASHSWILITRDKFGSWIVTNTLGLNYGTC